MVNKNTINSSFAFLRPFTSLSIALLNLINFINLKTLINRSVLKILKSKYNPIKNGNMDSKSIIPKKLKIYFNLFFELLIRKTYAIEKKVTMTISAESKNVRYFE